MLSAAVFALASALAASAADIQVNVGANNQVSLVWVWELIQKNLSSSACIVDLRSSPGHRPTWWQHSLPIVRPLLIHRLYNSQFRIFLQPKQEPLRDPVDLCCSMCALAHWYWLGLPTRQRHWHDTACMDLPSHWYYPLVVLLCSDYSRCPLHCWNGVCCEPHSWQDFRTIPECCHGRHCICF